MRINEIAKEVGKSNKELIEFVKRNGEDVSSHANKISEEMIAKVRKAFGPKQEKVEEAKKEEAPKKKLTAVFRPQNAQQKVKTARPQTEEGKSSKYINVSRKEENLQPEPPKEPLKVVEKVEEKPKEQPVVQSHEKETVRVDKGDMNQTNTNAEKVNTMSNHKQAERPVKNNDRNFSSQNRGTQTGGRDERRNTNFRNDRAQENRGGERPFRSNENRSGERNFRSEGGRDRSGDNRPFRNDRDNRSFNRDGKPGENRGFSRDGKATDGRSFNRDGKPGENRGFNRDAKLGENRSFNRDGRSGSGFQRDRNSGGFFKDGGFSAKDKDEAPARNQRPALKKDAKPASNMDGSLVKKTTATRPNKNNFKEQKNDKRHRTEDGPSKGGKVSKHPFIMPVKKAVEIVAEDIKEIILPERMTIKDFATKLKLQPSAIVKKLFLKGQIVTLNTELSFEQLEEIALEYDIICTPEEKIDVIAELLKEDAESEDLMEKRPPVVCVMGHVDHGKTSLLDAIRSTNVTSHEAGGITQHIGAYMVKINDEPITFLDTPGHEAFTAMRMRGAMSTDIAILVVAADDGVMPQTVEAINHAKAAGVEIIVAINKVDKPSANIDRVKQELSEYELIPEDWGGSTIFCPVSAKTREGIENLLEMIILAAEVKELKANKTRKARGLVIEAELDKGRGPVATILVQKGTLRVGDFVAAGACHGKVRAMMNDKGQRVKEATPSTPVEILGLNNVPNAGEVLVATESDKEAKDFAATFISENKNKLIEDTKAKLSLDDLFTQIKAGNIKELPIIIKADVQGSVEAVKQSLSKLSNEEVAVKVIHGGVGAINESDVSLASASNAIIIGFNVRPDATAKASAEREKVDLRLYKIIYQAIEDVQAAMNGMLEPIYEEKVIGHAEIRQIFKASGIGNIAGSYILDGKFIRGCKVRITREGSQIFDGNLASLKRFKDDVKEVNTGYECGLVFEKFNDIQEFDLVEAYDMVEVPRK